MRVNQCIQCTAFPCRDVRREAYAVPDIAIRPDEIHIILVSECAPASPSDYYYAGGDSLLQRTTVQAFNDAGVDALSIRDLLSMGIYFTTAVKCAKSGSGIETRTIQECSLLLEQELMFFPNAEVLLLMGDVAIKAVNMISIRAGEGRVTPGIPTYKLRDRDFEFRGMRVFPSYLQAGPSFFIEKNKRRMIAEDIAAALQVIR